MPDGIMALCPPTNGPHGDKENTAQEKSVLIRGKAAGTHAGRRIREARAHPNATNFRLTNARRFAQRPMLTDIINIGDACPPVAADLPVTTHRKQAFAKLASDEETKNEDKSRRPIFFKASVRQCPSALFADSTTYFPTAEASQH